MPHGEREEPMPAWNSSRQIMSRQEPLYSHTCLRSVSLGKRFPGGSVEPPGVWEVHGACRLPVDEAAPQAVRRGFVSFNHLFTEHLLRAWLAALILLREGEYCEKRGGDFSDMKLRSTEVKTCMARHHTNPPFSCHPAPFRIVLHKLSGGWVT